MYLRKIGIISITVAAIAFIGAAVIHLSIQQAGVRSTLEDSGDNRRELETVLNHYRTGKKRRAARFLIANMDSHYSDAGPAIDWYKSRMLALLENPEMRDSVVRYSKIYESEAKELFPEGVVREYDHRNVSAEFLIENIDDAFDAWKSSPWRKDIPFRHFCRYILPYRVGTEQLVPHWRDSLRAEYAPFVEGVTDLNEAFAKLSFAVEGKMSYSWTTHYPYSLDVLSIRTIRFAICEQRGIVRADVLRAFGIPVTVDSVPRWANYGTTGHSWIAMPRPGRKTYTVYEKDTVARSNYLVSTSYFKPVALPDPAGFPYHLDSLKIPFKVYRREFAGQGNLDVSRSYGFDGKVTIKSRHGRPVLYTFKTGTGWEFAANACWAGPGRWTFRHLGTNVMYLSSSDSVPFILKEGSLTEPVLPDGVTQSVRLHRKYLLTTHWTNRWNDLRGGVFEAADNPDFSDAVQLDSIAEIPMYHNEKAFTRPFKFRFIRFVYPEGAKLRLEHFNVYCNGRTVDGKTLGNDFNSSGVDYALNHNIDYKSPPKGFFWQGLDFGRSEEFDAFSYDFLNDDNFIVPGEEYELLYWDGSWQSLGRKTAMERYIDYDNVPSGALLLLKNLTKGNEERPFVYKNGMQFFY